MTDYDRDKYEDKLHKEKAERMGLTPEQLTEFEDIKEKFFLGKRYHEEELRRKECISTYKFIKFILTDKDTEILSRTNSEIEKIILKLYKDLNS